MKSYQDLRKCYVCHVTCAKCILYSEYYAAKKNLFISYFVLEIFVYYYIDASVLLENNQWHIFHILGSEDVDEVVYRFLHWIYIIKTKLHGGLKIWILSSRGENNILLIGKILFSPLEAKIHIFTPPYNILYM